MLRARRRIEVGVAFVLLWTTVLAACSMPLGPRSSSLSSTSDPPPRVAPASAVNIVEVLADDMRLDDLRYAPNLRRLVAAQGITMSNAFSGYPLCCPARASFFSGQLTHNHGVFTVRPPYGYRAFDDSATIATALEDAGYHNGLVGKYLNNYGADPALAPAIADPDAPPVQSQYHVPDGWDDWKAGLQGVHCRPACGSLHAYYRYAYSDNGRPTSTDRGSYSTDVMGRHSVRMAHSFHRNRVATGEPFFMSVNYLAPHIGQGTKRRPSAVPYRVRRPDGTFRTDYIAAPAVPRRVLRLPLIKRIKRAPGIQPNGRTEADVSDKPGRASRYPEIGPAEARALAEVTRRRAAAIYVMDKNIGRLIKQLKADGEWDRTVFVFWSDNGFFLGEHRRATGKLLAYEPALRVPMLITGPGMRDGSQRFDPMDVPDLTATILDLAGAEPPRLVDGRSMLPVLEDGDRGWTTAIGTEAVQGDVRSEDPRTSIGVRTARYLYVRNAGRIREIYDLWTDPHQWRNLSQDRQWLRTHQRVVDALDEAWATARDCAGAAECDTPLPGVLQVDAATVRRQTLLWHQAIAATFRR